MARQSCVPDTVKRDCRALPLARL